jgi:hypothetical protein
MAGAKQRVSDFKPYVERALKDEEIRENIRNAFFAARDVYDELLGGRGASALAARVATDEDIRESLRKAVDELRHAADRVRGRDEHTARNTLLLLSGVVIGIFFNPFTGPGARRWLKEVAFGSGGEDVESGSYDSNGR